MIKQREGDPKFPCWKWFWSLWTLWTRTVRVKEKRDPKSKQSKAKRDILKMRRVESLLVVFLFCFCRTVKLWVKRHFKRESTQAIFMLRKKRSQAPRKYELSLQLGCYHLKHSPLEFLPTAGNWEMSLTIEKLHVRTECVVDNLCSVKQTRVHFKKEKQSSQLNW